MIDLIEIDIASGAGGDGFVSFRREKYVPRGGPDGGDGGRGGDVILRSTPDLTTLAHFRHRRAYKAESGQAGAAGKRHGRTGHDLVIEVPIGTVVSVKGGDESWDLTTATEVIVAKGGTGGRGNSRFANSIRQAPAFAEKGMAGAELELRLELKLLADVGLVGLPNAGKSTLLGVVSHASPEVAAFPFTTLEPVLGVVDMGIDSFVMADMPGLIEGAHEGVGLGHEFLRHVERTRVLVHLIDISSADPIADYRTIRQELEMYDEVLGRRREIIALNKIDIPDARERLPEIEAALPPGSEVFSISGATGEGVKPLMQRLQAVLQEERPQEPATSEMTRLPVLRPRGRDRMDVVEDDGIYVVSGEQAMEAAARLGSGGDDAIDELQGRLKRQGLDRLMRRAGARPGDPIRVGDVELEWVG